MEIPSADELRRQAEELSEKGQSDFDEVVSIMQQVRQRSIEMGIAPKTDTAWFSDDEPLVRLTGWQVFCGATENWDHYLKVTTDGRIFAFRQPNSDEGYRLHAQDNDGYFGDYGASEFSTFNSYAVDMDTIRASVLAPQQWAGATGTPLDVSQTRGYDPIVHAPVAPQADAHTSAGGCASTLLICLVCAVFTLAGLSPLG